MSAIKAGAITASVLALLLAGAAGFFFFQGRKDSAELARLKGRNAELETEMAAKAAQFKKLSDDAAAAKQNADALQAESEKMKAELESLRSEREKVDQALKDWESQKAQLEAERQKQLAAQSELEANLKKAIESKDVVISKLEGKLKVNVADKILFASGSAFLTPQGEAVLRQLAQTLANAADQEIRIEGHTDNVPISASLSDRYATNWELSTARATIALRFLNEDCGVPEERLSAVGYGSSRPVVPNDTPENQARNRRIDIILAPLVK